MTGRALSFGAVAADYERFRPGYPDELVDAVLAYADGEVRTALEIGAGTGKATRAFAARGIAVTATDPDAAMLAELRRHVPASVRTVRGAFEELDPGATYDLVFAAAALHWTRPEGRWERVAGLLGPGGTFASFGGQVCLADDALEDAVRAAREPWLADDSIAPPDGSPPASAMQWPGTELLETDLFADVRQIRIERWMTMSAADFVSHLSTISAYLELAADDRAQAFERILAVLPETVAIVADLDLHLARLA
ncbi:SAM-dependent methyltransferase [Nocardioides ginsengisegetis]|uniref:SAM-dependent methyltransferase n=1 Tax=Nocardioides ginsengisegetis TaxID=661491 RepID=A0A7W3IZU1_9ACTN|nr:class I SAM-dependent methyltransferase [Nocardioides ginsengisegetis]MBA8803671.1 SAM-dependent methyltransferase [Nocardioides ginsengisegetis]